MNRIQRIAVAAAVGSTALALTACGGGGAAPAASESATKSLEVFSWWTSGSESAALNVLFADFRKAAPGVDIVNGAVAGGGGSNAQVVMATRLAANNPPDVWQTHPGASIHEYIGAGLVADVSSVYAQDNLSSALPKGMLDAVSQDGKQYGVSTGAHRINVLWFNKKLLAKAGVKVPSSGYTVDAFISDLAKVKSSGAIGLCRGAKDPFATAELFENNMLSVLGVDGWGGITADDFRWDGPEMRQSMAQFSKVVSYADPEAAALTWDAATKKLASGGCAFMSLNDSAYGELIKAGAKEGTDFGWVPYPGTDAAFLTVVDTFVAATNAKDAQNARTFLATIGTKETQLAFNKVKGSVPVRTDVDVSSLPAYQQAAAKAYKAGPVLMSIAHGEAMPPQFQRGFYDAIAAYVDSGDVNAFNNALRDATNEVQPPAH